MPASNTIFLHARPEWLLTMWHLTLFFYRQLIFMKVNNNIYSR